MDNTLFTFERHPALILLCFVLASGYAYLLYLSIKPSWGRPLNNLLLTLRTIIVFIISLLLLAPVIRYIDNLIEKPIISILIDNSLSVSAVSDSVTLQTGLSKIMSLSEKLQDLGYEVEVNTLTKQPGDLSNTNFDATTTNIQQLFTHTNNIYEGRNLKGTVLVSDGIYTSGASPLFMQHNYAIHAIGIGDTVPKQDISIRQVRYNKVSYQGNKFPVEVDIFNEGYANSNLKVSLMKGNRVVSSQSVRPSKSQQLSTVKLEAEAVQSGLQRYLITVEAQPGEFTENNNRENIFVQVIDGKETILLVSSGPHPDIKAFRSAIESNPNYKVETYIPGVTGVKIKPEEIDLVIYYGLTGNEPFLNSVLPIGTRNKAPVIYLYGNRSRSQQLAPVIDFIDMKFIPNETDQVTGVFNQAFSGFKLSAELQAFLRELPPVTVPFGEINVNNEGEALLFQRVGSIETGKPLFVVSNGAPRKAILFGEGLWRWRPHDYLQNGNHDLFNELISKLIQFTTTVEDKRKLRVFPVDNKSINNSVFLETEVYNDLFEQIYGTAIDVTISDEQGNKTSHSFVASQGNSGLRINGLNEGVHTFEASTVVNNQTYRSKGEFMVRDRQIEFSNLTADFNLLRKLSAENNGHFFTINDVDQLVDAIDDQPATGIIHSNETFQPAINFPLLLVLLLGLSSLEWTLRKYNGSY